MPAPLQLTLTDVSSPDEVERRVRLELGRLAERHPHITGCRVTMQGHPGTTVRVALSLPTGEILIDHESGGDTSSSDPLVTIRESFVAARRALLLHARELRAEGFGPDGALRARASRSSQADPTADGLHRSSR